ncbi:cytochrome p450 protein [Rutstroemia sp. NJR-2017a BVV2]|nr:cytochrome p450 protein [Rutstroemia sp. NJR-2017a BVV2]
MIPELLVVARLGSFAEPGSLSKTMNQVNRLSYSAMVTLSTYNVYSLWASSLGDNAVGIVVTILFCLTVIVKEKKAIGRRFYAWSYLFWGPKIIQDAYEKANGKPFEVLAPDTRHVFVSSIQHVKELDTAADTVLSLQAASKHMLQPKYTMHGFNWYDRRGTEGVGFIRALRTHLTNNLPQILPDLGIIVKTRFAELHAKHKLIGGRTHVSSTVASTRYLLANNLPNCRKQTFSSISNDREAGGFVKCGVIFWERSSASMQLESNNEQFMISALAYIEETIIGAEVMRLIPKFLAPFVGGVISSKLNHHATVFNTLLPVAQQRCEERDRAKLGQDVPKHADCIQWIMETSPRQNPWSAQRIVHELMAIWFGSVHAMSTTVTFAIHDLCLHPEYVEPLRQECRTQYSDFERTSQGLPLLDSFLKESARMMPVESSMRDISSQPLLLFPIVVSTRRYALQPFTLSDGTKLDVGDWACTPVKAMMHNPNYYPEPFAFNGFRFVKPELLSNLSETGNFDTPKSAPSKLTDVNDAWHVWGTGRMACPGRWYAVAVLKVITGQIIMNYDCKLVDTNAKRWMTWRSTMVPKSSTMVVFIEL